MLRMFRILTAGLLVLGALTIASASPAHAAETGVINFTGNASIASPGLSYPVVNGGPRTLPFSFSSTTCADASDVPQGGASCSIATTSGTVTGFCGQSTGVAAGSVRTSSGTTYAFKIKWSTSAGGTLVIENNGGAGTVAGEVTAVPTTGSCATGTATGFTVAGNFAFSI
jgi:hypothetical protein